MFTTLHRRSSSWHWCPLVGVLLVVIGLPADAQETVRAVKARGELRCGVSEGIAGFSLRDARGQWTGLDADFCRAVAAATLGDPNKVRFIPLKASQRFPVLKSRGVDLLARNTSWTMSREVLLRVQFPAVLFYDGQTFMVPSASGVAAAAELRDALICVEKGTTHERNLVNYFSARGSKPRLLVIDSAAGAARALYQGRCAAYSSDSAQLAALRLLAPGGELAWVILPERISREPLGPVVRDDDVEWTSLVRWVLFALIGAEDFGITRANVRTALPLQLASATSAEAARRDAEYIWRELGLAPDWIEQVISSGGNYGEMFERNLGAGSRLRLQRGLNRSWKQGGLMYAPPLL